jgi:C-terminal processing protease CtpA/Prc
VLSLLSACTGGRPAEILAVDGVVLAGRSSDDVRVRILGTAGASVALTVLPPGCSNPTIIRLMCCRGDGPAD